MARIASHRLLLCVLLVISVSCLGQKTNKSRHVRPPAVAGSFYPADSLKLINQLADLFSKAKKPVRYENVAALIAPHAGYVFSGEAAASAYAQLDPNKNYQRIFLIGTSHQMLLKGASVYNKGNFSTPLGIVEVDLETANHLIAENALFEAKPEAHDKEHSLEVQLPFLQYHLKNKLKIVPIVIGTQTDANCRKIAETLRPYFNHENLFVISSDFSHYPTYEGALMADKKTGDAIATKSTEEFIQTILENKKEDIPGLLTSCCGWSAILTLLYLTEGKTDIEINHIKYMNSGDSNYGDKSKVVGYHAFSFNRKDKKEERGFSLSESDKKQLLAIARQSIDYWLLYSSLMPIDDAHFSETIKTDCGAFVTLHKNGRLRGCIGRFTANESLYKIVQQMAIAAAFQDYRFEPVEKPEMKEIDIEISALTPLKKIDSIDEFVLGKHGIYMKKEGRSGTFLPQVATETGWSRDEFLGHCARDKAGIGWDGWKDADLFTYEALIFGEKEFDNRE